MLDRLKSLPLTILLTILIWMYAEAQFTTTQPEVPISVRIVSGSPEYAVRVMDPVEKRYTNVATFQVSLQGPKNQIDQIFQDAQGAHDVGSTDKLAALTYIPTTDQLRLAAGAGGLHPNVLQMLNSMEYFRSRGVTVTFSSPNNVHIEVSQVTRLQKAPTLQSAIAVESWTLDPPEVELQIPADVLRNMGQGRVSVRAIPQDDQLIATAPPETEKTVPVHFEAVYPGPRDDRIRVIPGNGTAKIKTQKSAQSSLPVQEVPIWVSGPPGMLARYDVEVIPKTVTIMVAGPQSVVEATRARLAAGGAQAAGIFVYLDLSPEDKAEPTAMARRSLRYVLPAGLTLARSQPDAGFRLTEKSAAATQTAPGNQ